MNCQRFLSGLRAGPRQFAARLALFALAGALPASEVLAAPVAERPPQRQFIAHRGVHLRSTIAGENSLESIRYARRAGFATIETDVRLTADGELVAMHDETLNRTCRKADGSKLPEPVPVASVTLAELKANYVLKAKEHHAMTRVPTLREFLVECHRQALVPFIEPKLKDPTGAHYRDIIQLADEVLGAGNYIVTSNNFANQVIRDLGREDIRLMGILYQTTFEEIAGLGNVIMAISTSRFSADEFSAHVARSVAAGIPTESHADDFARFSLIDAHPIDYVSTDRLAPDLPGDAKIIARRSGWHDFVGDGQLREELFAVPAAGSVRLREPLARAHFGGVYLEIELKGECRLRLADQEFTLRSATMQRFRHQLMVHERAPEFVLTAREPCEIRSIRVTWAEF